MKFMLIYHRVATDLENLEKSGNLKETSESQGICNRIPKVREKSENFVVWNSFSAKLKILILKIFWGSMPPDPPKWSRTHCRAQSWSGKVRGKSGNFILSGKWQPWYQILIVFNTYFKTQVTPNSSIISFHLNLSASTFKVKYPNIRLHLTHNGLYHEGGG